MSGLDPTYACLRYMQNLETFVMQGNIEVNTQHSNKIYYWNGIVDPRGLSSDYESILNKIIEGNYNGLDLEKLSGHHVFSVRVNRSNRLLFTTIRVNDKPYLMLLDEVLNHDYAKSRFLKPEVLKYYLELHGKPISEEIINSHFETCQKPSLETLDNKAPAAPIHYSRAEFYNQKFIELDAGQLEIATKTTLPLVISGAPGSGKSCIALLILAQYVESHPDKNDYPIVYITESENLAKSMKQAWRALPVAQSLPPNAVTFKCYQKLIKELAPKAADMTFVGKEHCYDFINDRIKQYKIKNRKGNSLSNAFFADIDSLYQEFRIISACADFKAYKTLGQKQSLVHNEAEKQWLFSTFQSYQKVLEDKQCIHAPFYRLNLQNQYKRIVVDEAQDLSHLQLQTLANLACNKQICFCEDNRQSLSDNKSKIPFLKGLMHTWGCADNQITLKVSYRCPKAVIDMANVVSGLKSLATGDGQPDIAAPLEQTRQGSVQWFEAFTDEELAAMQQAASSPDFAVITLKEFKAEASKLLQTPLVFTAEEIKGLEYKHIMAWRLLDAPLFKEANKIIGNKSLDEIKTTSNRAKNGQSQEQFGPLFNSVYTAFTRPTDTLSIYQVKHHHLQNICNPLLKAIPGAQAILANETSTKPIENNEDKWFEQVKVQIAQGNHEIARDIYLTKLNKTPAEFEEFRALF